MMPLIFSKQSAQARAERGLVLPPDRRAALERHQDALLAGLAARFDVDVAKDQKQLFAGTPWPPPNGSAQWLWTTAIRTAKRPTRQPTF